MLRQARLDVYPDCTSVEHTMVEGSVHADKPGFRTRALTGTSFDHDKPLFHVFFCDLLSYSFTCTLNKDLI